MLKFAALLAVVLLWPASEVEFVAVDVLIDSGRQPLAAYQLEIKAPNALIVGVEGGESKSYSEPPYYDPAALKGGRIILAAFTLDENPPTGRVRVARVHLQQTGPTDYASKLMVAAAPGGQLLDVKIELVRKDGKK